MDRKGISRRTVLKAGAALTTASLFAEPLRAAAPPPAAVTPTLIEAARKEGKASFYTALELNTSERLARAFEAKYPGIAIRVERSGAERIFQRIAQEQGSRVYAVDVVCSTDPSHFLDWTAKDKDWVEPYVTEDMAKHFPREQVDASGMHATLCAWLEVIGYNTTLVTKDDAPKSYADLLLPKWKGKLAKGHPGYSGAILTTTYLLVRDLGWEYLEKLAQQKVLQLQSAADPPKKIVIGERAVMADGNDYSLEVAKAQGKPVEIVHPLEGSPVIPVPSGIFRSAPNPNAARLFQQFLFSVEAQQIFIDVFAHRSFHALAKETPGRAPLSSFKLLQADPKLVLAQTEEIKARYSKLFV
ncbi:MAG TPA: extracellular solute-binding protein [Pseudolabrys sp.]|nr:extracellular solute-binding protein [Pseudolabrys sp.]